MLSINTGSIKEVVSLWLALCILMQVPHFVVPTGSKSRRLQRERAPQPASLTAANLTLNVHLQINSCGFGENREKEGEAAEL